MQNLKNRIRKLEELELTTKGKAKKRIREELLQLRRIVLRLSTQKRPIQSRQIEYDTFITN